MIKKFNNFLDSSLFKYLGLLTLLILFSLLLAKNPFSVRTLIPNLEPFPDTFHYLVPVKCFVQQHQWKLCNSIGTGTNASVPPLYSLLFLPVFAFGNMPQGFYFINLALAFASLVLFFLILNKISKNNIVNLGLTFLFVTSYHIYWFPTLVMAENLIIFLTLAALYHLYYFKNDYKHVILASVLTVSFFGTKFASLPITASFGLIYLFLILKNARYKLAESLKYLITYFSAGAIFLFILTGEKLFIGIFDHISGFFISSPINSKGREANPNSVGWFSASYFPKNFLEYVNIFLGKPIRVLWDTRSMIPLWVGITSFFAYFASYKTKKYLLPTAILLIILSQIIFMSFFYTFDGRYVITIIPLTLILSCIGFDYVSSKLRTEANKLFFSTAISLIIILQFSLSAVSLKNQIVLNLKYAEQPWWYLSVLEMNNYFASGDINDPKIITLINPYMIDFYGSGKFQVLPLSTSQDFHNLITEVWGIEDKDYYQIYNDELAKGTNLFITNMGTTGSNVFQNEFDQIGENYTLTKVHSGCYELCNIYKVEEKIN